MGSDRIAISVKGVSKNFRLPHQKTSSVKDLFIHPLRAISGAKTAEVQHALRDINLDVKEGEFFGIVGRNGSGKSTLLKILAEIYQPTKGEVSVVGKLVPFIELGVGFNPELTGRENVYLSGALNGFSDKEIDEMYDDIVAFAELEPFMDQLLKNYSSGMQVRLAFSVATRSSADILLIDEVLAVGDADFQRKCFEYFKRLKKEKKTVIFISHDMAAVEDFCDRAALIDKSQLTFIGEPAEATMLYRSIMAPKDKKGDHGSGTGEVKIKELRVLREGKAVTQISEGEGFDVEVRYQANKEVKDPVFGLAIVNEHDTVVAGPHTQEAEVRIDAIRGEGRVVASFKVNSLTSGSYTFMASCFNEDLSVPYDFINRAGWLEITGKKRYGAVNLEPEWLIEQTDEKEKASIKSLTKG